MRHDRWPVSGARRAAGRAGRLASGLALAAGLGAGLGGCAAQRGEPAAPAAASAVAGPVQGAPFDAAGYRTGRYRAPVDRDPAPARRIALDAAFVLVPGRDALFLDVMPVEGGVRDATSGVWQLSEGHETIPGAQWHPETGRGTVDPLLWQAMRDAVHAARLRHPRWPVVVFCRSDCWMSWNAARRLARDGVRGVLWLAEGIDGWHGAGRALVPATPVAVAPSP